MLKFTLEHEINCSEVRFWELFLEPDFTRDMIVDGLGFASCEVGALTDSGDTQLRPMQVVPKLVLPAAVAKILGPRLGYSEAGVWHPKEQWWRYDLRLSVLTERISIGGKVTTKPLGEDKCVRVSSHEVNIKIFGIGSLAERAAETNMVDGWNKSAVWMNRWLAEQGP
ncbi:MAG: DUF2505 domain-containing protein [Nannocystaceae bacterium]|nr:DUF2505 domain-containing protein [Nannocystaceae bacterium]